MPPPTRKVNAKVVSTQKQTDDKMPSQISCDGQTLLKHAHIPAIPNSNMVLFHLVALTFNLTATVMQYLHLYRTVWWLPQSHAKKALNFYLIDTHLVGYLIVMESVPFLYSLYKQVMMWENRRAWFAVSLTITMMLWLFWALAFLFFSLCVYKKNQGFYLLILFYPPIAYAVIYYHFIPFKMYGKTKVFLKSFIKSILLLDIVEPNTDKVASINNSSQTPIQNGTSTSLNNGLDSPSRKPVLLEQTSASISTLYSTSASSNDKAMASKQNAIHYDGIWCGQHVFVTAVTAFLLYSVQHLTPAYVDVLHRCALHLGRWRREEGRCANVPYNPWSQLQIFPQGALVKHVRGLFRAVGVFNSAEPANNMHNRFFYFFYPALRLTNVMCTLVILVLLFQYFLLFQNYEWYKLISVASMMFFNVLSLYKILRNRFLLGRCYKEESLSNNNNNNTININNTNNCNSSISAVGTGGATTSTYHVHSD